MKLNEYFAAGREQFLHATPATGERTEWLDFCELDLKGGSVLIADAQFMPSEEDGLRVTLAPAKYVAQCKVANFSGDRRIARLRVFQSGATPKLGQAIGETWTDTAKTGFCDFEVFSKAWGTDDDASYAIIEPYFNPLEYVGIAILDAATGAVMPFVDSGFGDGTYSVFELLEDGQRVGFEIEFLADDEEYSFGETPWQIQCQVNDLTQRAEQGDAEAQFQLGKMYRDGDRVAKDLEKAVPWFDRAAQNGHVEAALKLGYMFEKGQGVTQDYSRARELYELAAAGGSGSALNSLGLLYQHGYGVPQSYEKAATYYQQAADKGSSHAQNNLGYVYFKGLGVPQSYETAVKWYRLAADQKLLTALFALGNCHRFGWGVPKDEKEAVKYYELGAMDNPACANNLADCYENGCGVEKDLKTARFWYTKAAMKNHALAQRSLGLFCKNGEGADKKNLPVALKWLTRAAENGVVEAYSDLASIYETGDEDVAADKLKACRFYQKAVNGGYAAAKENLDRLLATLTEKEQAAFKENIKNDQ